MFYRASKNFVGFLILVAVATCLTESSLLCSSLAHGCWEMGPHALEELVLTFTRGPQPWHLRASQRSVIWGRPDSLV